LTTPSAINEFVKKNHRFYFPFVRKLIITAPSLGFVIFPGGFGTMHQLFGAFNLGANRQSRKNADNSLRKKFWSPLDEFIRNIMLKKFHAIHSKDVDLYHVVDSKEEAMRIIKENPRKEF